MRITWILAVALSLALSSSAMGIIMDDQGRVTDWGVQPFSLPNGSYIANGMYSTIENNYSPISFPGIGHVPSPGAGGAADAFDLEEMHVHMQGSRLQALVVTSSAWSVAEPGGTVYLGDLFINVNGTQYAIVTQSANQGLTQGSVYRINGPADTVALQNTPGSYLGWTTKCANDYGPDATVADIAGPWAVKGSIDFSQLVGTATLTSATHNYGGAEDNTFLLEYSVDGSLLGLGQSNEIVTKIAWGCGNDVIRVTDDMAVTPEPASLLLMAGGAMVVYTTHWRRRNRARK